MWSDMAVLVTSLTPQAFEIAMDLGRLAVVFIANSGADSPSLVCGYYGTTTA